MKKAMIAMSGGVDSSVAAYLMGMKGFDCIGATMKLFPKNVDVGKDGACRSPDSADDALGVASKLSIPHYVFDFSEEFESMVVRRFAGAYERGDTPNPCVDCNRYVKFGILLSRAVELGCDFLVTGHYARIEWDGERGRFSLKKALDDAKDQSYFLCSMTQEQLARTLFPLGGMSKKEVRDAASAQGFLNAQKRESQDICFIAGESYSDFIERYTGNKQKPGDFIDCDGKPLGRHKGMTRYTIGQRKGLGIASANPLYVCAKNVEDNTVTLGGEKMLYSTTVSAGSFNWIRPRPVCPVRVMAKTRYRQADQWATIVSAEDDFVRIEFDEPQRAVAPGQALALYDGDDVVGGGTIKNSWPHYH
jgi:tRNA-specific 2-thiouridylase